MSDIRFIFEPMKTICRYAGSISLILTAVSAAVSCGDADTYTPAIILGEETVIVQGMTAEENLWGPYQFPRPYNLGDRLVVAVHVAPDDISSFGEANRWFESYDKGRTWRETDPSVASECGLLLPDGDRIYFPMENGISLDAYEFEDQQYNTPDYDYSEKAAPGKMPLPDGMSFQMWGIQVNAYRTERLPEELDRSEWLMLRTPAGGTEAVREYAKVDWPYLTRVVHIQDGHKVLKPIFPRGNPKLGPDGAVWIACFSGEGHINPENGLYSPYYSAEIFRSEDGGRTFSQRSHLEYPADGKMYPYSSGGFSDSDFEFFPDGSMVWFLRSNWYGNTGKEWHPMYMTRSEDMGKTWSAPVEFAPCGTLPRLCRLDCGATLLCYARPGTFISVSTDKGGRHWSKPVEVMTAGDRSGLSNNPPEKPSFSQWAGSCNNPEMIAIDDSTALLFYSDFYYPDSTGVKRKTVLCRRVTVRSH